MRAVTESLLLSIPSKLAMTIGPRTSSTPLLPDRTNSQSSSFLGIFLVALTAILYCFPVVIARYISYSNNFPVPNLIFLRTFVHFILALLSLFHFRPPLPPSLPVGLLVLARGALGGVSITLFYYAISIIPIGLASTVFASNTIITFVISHLTLHEPFTPLDFFFTILAFIGVAVLSLSANDRHDLVPIIAALGTAVLSSIGYVVVRGCRQHVHFIWFVVSFGFCGTTVAATMMGFDKLPTVFAINSDVAFAMLTGVAGFAANCSLNKGLMLCNAGEAAVILTLRVPVAYLLGGLVMGEWPSLVRTGGAIMVMAAVVAIAVKRLKQR